MLLGFYETNYNGHRVIGHGGDTQWFHSDLHLFLDDGVGLFISMNSPGQGRRVAADSRRRCSSSSPIAISRRDSAARRSRRARLPPSTRSMIAGAYDNSRRTETQFPQPPEPRSAQLKVTVNEDGTISVAAADDASRRAAQVARGRAVRVARGGRQAAAGRPGRGRPRRLASASSRSSPFMVFRADARLQVRAPGCCRRSARAWSRCC